MKHVPLRGGTDDFWCRFNCCLKPDKNDRKKPG